ncbi:MAG: hypothetical protein LBO69_01955 [Ignavibacteria bacterium]|jgi:hypothetical protein|nr:hypothetical protein [Ignavibacteria bacterium]
MNKTTQPTALLSKFFIASVLIIIGLLASTSNSNAQPNGGDLPIPIGWDGEPAISPEELSPVICPIGFFNGPEKVAIPLSATCSLEVHYCWRVLNNSSTEITYYDVWVSEYKIIDNCDGCCQDFITALDNDPSYYIQRAWEHIALIEHPWGDVNFSQCPDQTAEYWRLGKVACYSQVWILVWVPDVPQDPTGDLGHFEYVKKPCFVGEGDPFISNWSCWQRFTVCQEFVNGKPVPVISEVENAYPTIKCSPWCKFICR